MQIITLTRDLLKATTDYTPGTMKVNGVDVSPWATIEDPLLYDGQQNVKEKCAIPFGRYELAITHSNRFGKPMPLVLNVPGRDGIRIHIANSSVDVTGCIGIGMHHSLTTPGWIDDSAVAYGMFFPWLDGALKLGKVYLDVTFPLPLIQP
jgi:hypothetical protein